MKSEPSPETLARFFQVAADVYRQAPWASGHESQVLRLDIPALGCEGACVSIDGDAHGPPGVYVYASIDAYRAFMLELTDSGMARDPDGGPANIPVLAVTFENVSEQPREDVRRARRQGWAVADNAAYPEVLFCGREGPELPAEAQYLTLTATLKGLLLFFKRHPQAFGTASAETPLVEQVVLADEPGSPAATLTAPHPNADWRWGEESLLDVYWTAEGEEIVSRFLAGEHEKGRSPGWLDQAGSLLDALFHFKIRLVGVCPDEWTARLVEGFLLEYVPSDLLLTDDEIDAFPEVLDRFFGWLAESGDGDRETTREVRERVARCRPAFLREARTPARFGPDKALSLRMQSEGVDLSDDDAVERYLQEFEVRASKDPSLRPPAPRPLGEATVSRKAWVWTPGEPVPDPKGPCPCGSGAPYRKCCRPR